MRQCFRWVSLVLYQQLKWTWDKVFKVEFDKIGERKRQKCDLIQAAEMLKYLRVTVHSSHERLVFMSHLVHISVPKMTASWHFGDGDALQTESEHSISHPEYTLNTLLLVNTS